MKKIFILSLFALLVVGCGSTETESETADNVRISADAQTNSEYAEFPLLKDIVAEQTNVGMFMQAIETLEAQAILENNHQVTVFIPTDEAFNQIPENIRTQLFQPEQKRNLDMLIAYHLVKGRGEAEDFTDGIIIQSLLPDNGILINKDEEGVLTINNGALVIGEPLIGSNGIAYLINSVLIPRDFLQTPEDGEAETTETTTEDDMNTEETTETTTEEVMENTEDTTETEMNEDEVTTEATTEDDMNTEETTMEDTNEVTEDTEDTTQ